jgi:hypothetical protein
VKEAKVSRQNVLYTEGTHNASELKRLTAFSGSSAGRMSPALPSVMRSPCQHSKED